MEEIVKWGVIGILGVLALSFAFFIAMKKGGKITIGDKSIETGDIEHLPDQIEERRQIDERIFAYSDFARKTDNKLYIRLKEIDCEIAGLNKLAEDHTNTYVNNFIINLKRLNKALYNLSFTEQQVAKQDVNFNILCRGEARYELHKELWRIYTVNHLKEKTEREYDACMEDNFKTVKNIIFDIFSSDWNTEGYKFETFKSEAEKHMNAAFTEFLVLMDRYGSLSVSKRDLCEEAKKLPDETEMKIQEVKAHLRITGKLPDYAM